MDARGREDSQSRRASIKRPWDEDTAFSQDSRTLSGLSLPPINAAPYCRTSESRSEEHGGRIHNLLNLDFLVETTSKRARYEGHDYDTKALSEKNLNINSKLLHGQSNDRRHNLHQSALETPTFARPRPNERFGIQSGDKEASESPGTNASSICLRCRRLVGEQDTIGVYKSCEECKNDPELAHVIQKAAEVLNQLAATLSWEISPDHRITSDIVRSTQPDARSADCPPVAQFGLRHTLSWILDRVSHVKELADKFVRHVPERPSPNYDKHYLGQGTVAHDGILEVMKRRMDADSDDSGWSRDDNVEPLPDPNFYPKRKSLTGMVFNEGLPSISSPQGLHRSSDSLEGLSRQGSVMNPPASLSRQYPSPPGRSLPSPTHASFQSLPSPSTGTYGRGPSSIGLPPPSSLQQSAGYLPPLGQSKDVLQAHSNALQHEVSLQKIALASLQGEHDKLLQAFSRSQIRANTLEKEHSAADSEIITLTEEKLRLQSQVIELERSAKDLARSRDEYREAAVQDGAQYVEIVKKASLLEELAGEDRKNWNRLRTEMERRIEELNSGPNHAGSSLPFDSILSLHVIDDTATATSSGGIKAESVLDTMVSQPVLEKDANGELREEIRRLRARCTELEDVIRIVRDESRNMERVLEVLTTTRKSILKTADRALG